MSRKPQHVLGKPTGWASNLASVLDAQFAAGKLLPLQALHIVPECASTQDVAKQLAESGARGAAVLAERQTSGRGRLGRSWDDTRAMGVPMTCMYAAGVHSTEQVALRSGLAACIACERVLARLHVKQPLGLRWPNDVVVDTGKDGSRIGRKLAGVLVETVAMPTGERVLLVGIGINALQRSSDWSDALRKKATSVGDIARVDDAEGPSTLLHLTIHLLHALAEVWAMKDSEVVGHWQPRSLLQGSWAIFDVASSEGHERVEGVVQAIDPLLRLTVKTKTGDRHLVANRTTLRHDLM